MEGDVFVYFVSIGAGASFGLSLGAIPALLVWRWITNRGGNNHDSKFKKIRAGA